EEAKGYGASVRADHRAERRDDVERRARPRALHPPDELVAVLLGLGVADSHVEVRIVLSLRRLAEDLLELTQRLRTATDTLQRRDLAVVEGQDRLHGEQLPGEARRLPDPPAAHEVLERVDGEEEP